MRKTKRHQEKGSSLLLAILALLLLSAIAAGMAFMSGTETKINANFKAEEAAYFAARAGIEEVRDRMLPANPNTINALLPTLPPTAATNILYVLNGATAADIKNSSSPYYDDDLCHEYTLTGMTQVTTPTRCTTQPTGYTFVTTPSVAPYALDYKWIRISQKVNGSAPYKVDSAQANTKQICWNGASETILPVGTTYCTGTNPVSNPVYLLTALAVTSTGARRLVQEEIAQTATTTSSSVTSTLPNIGMFAAGTACDSLQLGGNAKTGSFNSKTEGSPTNPPSNKANSNGNVGSNGSIDLQGSSTNVNGSISSNLPASVGSCPANGLSVSGGPSYSSLANFATPYVFPTPPTPVVASGSVTYNGATLTPGNFGNVTVKGTVTLTGGTVAAPAVYNMNSLNFNGSANLVITGPVIINLAGTGVSTVLDMTGGTFTNNTYVPSEFVINYGGTGNVVVTGGTAAYAIIDAPNAAVSFKGGADFFGQVLAKTIDDRGGTNFWWDQGATAITDITTTYTTTESANFYVISMRELAY